MQIALCASSLLCIQPIDTSADDTFHIPRLTVATVLQNTLIKHFPVDRRRGFLPSGKIFHFFLNESIFLLNVMRKNGNHVLPVASAGKGST